MMEKATIRKISKVLNLIKENPGLHVRGIAKALNFKPGTIDWILNRYLYYFVDISNINQFGFKVKLVTLKPDKANTTIEDVLRYMEVRNRIKGP
jgi:hypothetical protein